MPYATKTCTVTGTFKGGAPTSPTATDNGSPVTIANFSVNTLSGSGVRAQGVFSADVVMPVAGARALAVTMQQGAASVTNTFNVRVRPATDAYTIPAAIPFGLMAHGAAAPVGTLVESWPAFAKGHLGANQSLTVTVDGQVVPVQQDSEGAPWADGSVWGARTVWPMPVAMLAEAEKRMTISVVSGAPNRTPWITPQAIVAAHDYTLRAFGGLLGATVLSASLRDIVTNYPRDTWGTNPLGGWDVPVSGPYQVTIRGWRYVDAWHQLWMYVTANSDGTVEFAGNVVAPNFDGVVPNAPTGPTSGAVQDALVCAFEAAQDGVRFAAWGGANDVRTTTYTAAALFANGVVNLPNTFSQGHCVTFAPAAGGTLPSGITVGTPYWLGIYNYLPYSLHTAQGNVQNALAPVAFGTGGTGGIVVTPLMSSHGFSGLVLMAQDARAVRIGAARIDLAVNWDEDYMSRGSKLVPCYPQDASLVRYTSTDSSSTTQPYFPMAVPWKYWLNDYGDDPPDDRIGYVNSSSLRAWLLPYDVVFNQEMRRRGACWGGQPIYVNDVASGRLVVCDAGPDNAGGQYAGLGVSRPSVDWNTARPAAVMGTPANFSGYISGYSAAPIEGSHLPTPWLMAAHRTGHPIYADMGAAQANTTQMYATSVETLQGRTYHNIVGVSQQLRGSGWVLRAWDNAEIFTAATRPEAAYVKHMLDNMADWGAHHVLTATAADLKMGRVGHVVLDVGFFLSIFTTCLHMGVWRGRRPQLRTYAAAVANMAIGFVNDGRAGAGSGYVTGQDMPYHPNLAGTNGVVYSDIPTMIAAQADFDLRVAPYPATGFSRPSFTDLTNTFNTVGFGIVLRMALALAKSASLVSLQGDDAGLVYDLLDARIHTAPCTGVRFSHDAWSNPGRFGVKTIYAQSSGIPG